jgi:ketosteroid isomerase-like protein
MAELTHADKVWQWSDELVAACNGHDVEAVVACFADEYVNETPAHPDRGFRGRDQVRRNWQSIFAGVPDIRARYASRVVDGSTLWAEMEMDGTRRDGVPHAMRGGVIFTVSGGAATHARFYLEPVERASGDVNTAVERAVGVRS